MDCAFRWGRVAEPTNQLQNGFRLCAKLAWEFQFPGFRLSSFRWESASKAEGMMDAPTLSCSMCTKRHLKGQMLGRCRLRYNLAHFHFILQQQTWNIQ